MTKGKAVLSLSAVACERLPTAFLTCWQPLSMKALPSPLSSRAQPRDLRFSGPLLEMFFGLNVAFSVCFTEQPFSGVLYESVLHRTLKDLVAVSHIHVEHLVLGVGPYYWNIPGRQQPLDPEWVVCRIER